MSYLSQNEYMVYDLHGEDYPWGLCQLVGNAPNNSRTNEYSPLEAPDASYITVFISNNHTYFYREMI